jgi:hypothetical protein
MVIKHLVQAASLVLVAADTILDMFWCISCEMVGLALHRSDSGIEEEELQTDLGQLYNHLSKTTKSKSYPTIHLVVLSCSRRIGDLVLSIIFSNQVLLNAPGLK